MGVKRRAFLIGSVAIVGGGLFGITWADRSARRRAAQLTATANEASFATWLKIAADDTITLYSPHIDFGQGTHTALAQMLADELDADWAKVRVEQAPADVAFANGALAKGFTLGSRQLPEFLTGLVDAGFSMVARHRPIQITGGSSAIRATGQFGMRVVGASVRAALVTTAAKRLGVAADELTTDASVVRHAKSGKSLRYGELAVEAAGLSLDRNPRLKTRQEYRLIGKPIARLDIPGKVNGSAQYGIDFSLPDMRVATLMAAPVRGGKLESVDATPAMAIKGVEKVIQLDNAVAVIATGYWAAHKGLRALAPKFSDAGHAGLSSDSIFAAQDALRKTNKPDGKAGHADVGSVLDAKNAKLIEADYRVPFLHHAMMEPFALAAHFRDGKLDVWGGTQDPLDAKLLIAEAAKLDADKVTFHPMIMGGGFGRRFPGVQQILGQVTALALQLPYPIKLIWSREEDVKHGAYRQQCSAHLRAALGADGRIAAWQTDYVQAGSSESEAAAAYELPAVSRRHFKYSSNQANGPWRSVNCTQHGFYNESFMDELAHAAGVDPYEFRVRHLKAGSRQLLVLQEVAKRSGWGTPLPAGVGRGIAIVESFGTIVAEVVEASLGSEGTPKVAKVWAVVDCGTTVSPLNADAQIQGAIIMGLSAAIGESITIDKGAVVQSNFTDYPILKMAAAPTAIDVHFIESDAPLGGLGEPGLPPVAPALANALFAATGRRFRQLPFVAHA